MNTETSPGKASLALRRLAILVVAVVALVVAGAFAARSVFSQKLDEALDRLAGRGIRVECAERGLEGFPARFEIVCPQGASLVLSGLRLETSALRTATPLWDTDLILAGADSGRLETPLISADLSTLRASLRRQGTRIGRLSVTSAGLTGTTPLAPVEAASMEVHLLGREEAPADMQLALRAGGLRTPALDRLGAMDLVVSGLARGLSAHLGGNLDAALAGWLRQGARLDEALLLVRTGAVTMRAEGALAVDPADGLLSGEGTLAVTDIAALLRSFGLDDERLPAIAAGAALAGRPGEVDGQPALVFEYRIADGRLSVAGFQLFDIPPVQDWE